MTIERMSDENMLKNMYCIMDDLLKNAKHSYGIDFQRLNETGVEVQQRLVEKGINPMEVLKSKKLNK